VSTWKGFIFNLKALLESFGYERQNPPVYITLIPVDIVCTRLRDPGNGKDGGLAAKIRELLAGQLYIPLFKGLCHELENGLE
jgi:hypothetical protein